jgi:hypothetical protein
LAPLNAQIEQVLQSRGVLEERTARGGDRARKVFRRQAAVRGPADVCDALDKLGATGSGLNFSGGESRSLGCRRSPGTGPRPRGPFQREISGFLDKQAALQVQIEQRLDELDYLYEEVRDAHEREERRKEEFVIEREISPTPYAQWSCPGPRRPKARSISGAWCWSRCSSVFCWAPSFPLINVPIPDRSIAVVEIPERLAMLVKKEPPKPPPAPKPAPEKIPEETKPKPEPEKKETAPKVSDPTPEPVKVASRGARGTQKSRKRGCPGV